MNRHSLHLYVHVFYWLILVVCSEGGSLYLVNCTTERELCATHNIRGYPYITAFRGQGWLGFSHCVSPNSAHLPYTRTDYHGVIQVKLSLKEITNRCHKGYLNHRLESFSISLTPKDLTILKPFTTKKSFWYHY